MSWRDEYPLPGNGRITWHPTPKREKLGKSSMQKCCVLVGGYVIVSRRVSFFFRDHYVYTYCCISYIYIYMYYQPILIKQNPSKWPLIYNDHGFIMTISFFMVPPNGTSTWREAEQIVKTFHPEALSRPRDLDRLFLKTNVPKESERTDPNVQKKGDGRYAKIWF